MEEKKLSKISRRDTIKALATIPVLGYFGYAFKANMSKVKVREEERLVPVSFKRGNLVKPRLPQPT